MTETFKKVLSESDKVLASLLMKARKPKGLAKWKKLQVVEKKKLDGKEQKHIQFISYNPKVSGKIRTLASKEGALDFLMGYVSPKFHFAPWHLQVINPELDDKKAAEWFALLKHPSKVPPSMVEGVLPEGDFEAGFVHPCVAAEFPNKNIELFNIIEEPTEKEAIASPALVAPDAAPEELPQQEAGDPVDLLLSCPFGGGLRCRTMGGSGSPWHHFHSDSMKAHIAKIGEGNLEIPKMGTFKGQPALFFSNNDEPYVALPLTQEIYSKSGVVYKWNFLAEGPFAMKQPMVAKIMNQLAHKKPLIIPDFGIPEPVVSIAHDAVPSEDPNDAEFHPDVFPLIRDEFPRPGSVISLGIIKGDKIYAVVTDRSLDFYDELGKEVYYPAADGLYYAFFDLTGQATPAFVLITFVNTFLPNIDTNALEESLEAPTEAVPEAPVSQEAIAMPNGWWASSTSMDKVEAKLASQYLKHSKSLSPSGACKPSHWAPYDSPPFSVWMFQTNKGRFAISCESDGLQKSPIYTIRALSNQGAQTLNSGYITQIQTYIASLVADSTASLLGNMVYNSIAPGETYESLIGEIPPPPENLIDISKGISYKDNQTNKLHINSPLTTPVASSLIENLPLGWIIRMSGAPVSVVHKNTGYGCFMKSKGNYSYGTLETAAAYLVSQSDLAFKKYGKEEAVLSVFKSLP